MGKFLDKSGLKHYHDKNVKARLDAMPSGDFGYVNANTATSSADGYWAKVWSLEAGALSNYTDADLTILGVSQFNQLYTVLSVFVRNSNGSYTGRLQQIVGNGCLERFRLYVNDLTGAASLWYNVEKQYGCMSFRTLHSQERFGAWKLRGTLHRTQCCVTNGDYNELAEWDSEDDVTCYEPVQVALDGVMTASEVDALVDLAVAVGVANKADKVKVDTTYADTTTLTGSTIQPNRYYRMGEMAVIVIGSIATPDDETEYYEIYLEFTTASSFTFGDLPSGWTWESGTTPTFYPDGYQYRVKLSMGYATVECFTNAVGGSN